MTKQDEIQEKIINQILERGFRGIVESSVRSGKCRILLKCIQKLGNNPKILVLYPNIDIKTAWEGECLLIGFSPDITYCTFASIAKMVDLDWDIVIIDEGHLLGEENQVPIAAKIVKKCPKSIIASGTFSNHTLQLLIEQTDLSKIVEYNTDMAIKDEIICDYEIIIHEYNLDSTALYEFGKTKKWQSTELKECNRLSRKVDTSYGQEKMFHALNRMRFINSSKSLINTVKKWISQNQEKRFILFTSDENTGKNYNLPIYNYKSENDSFLQDFKSGKINQLCLIRKGRQGITYPNLQHIVITAIDSNSENLMQAIGRSLLKDTERAKIHIFISNQTFQKNWLDKAITNIPKDKISRGII